MKCQNCLERIPGGATACRYCGQDTAASRDLQLNRNLMLLYLATGAAVVLTLGLYALR